MLDSKKIKLIINTIFVLYLIISFFAIYILLNSIINNNINITVEGLKVNYEEEYSKLTNEDEKKIMADEFNQMTDKDWNELVQSRLTMFRILTLVIAFFMWLFINIIWIVVYIISKHTSKKIIKEKLNKDDCKNNVYYRDLLDENSMSVIALIDSFQLEYPQVIVAEILQMENKGIININEGRIVLNNNYNSQNLTDIQKYLLGHLQDGKIKSINPIEYKMMVEKEAVKNNLIKQQNNIRKVIINNAIKLITVFVILSLVSNMIFGNSFNYSGNSIITLFIGLGLVLCLILKIFVPIVIVISTITYAIKLRTNPYYRTEKGEELNKNIEGLKKYLSDYTMLDEKQNEELVMWNEYLVYSVLFGQNTKIIKEYSSYIV